MSHRVLVPALAAAALTLTLPSAPAQAQLYRLDGASAGAEYGTSLAVLGDLDGDGADDFAAGAPLEAARQGVVRIHSGRTGAVLNTLAGAGIDDFFGHALAAVDDVDADGFKDLVVGAPEREILIGDCEGPGGGFGTSYGPGYVTVVSGASGGVLYTLPSPGGFSIFGFALAGGGDVDDDGGADFLVPLGYGGLLHIYDGASGALIRVDDLSALGATYAAAVLGPVDQNPGDDYVVSWIDYYNCFSGGVRAFRGKSGSPFWTDYYCVPGDEYGFQVAAAGDVNGDGVADVVACGLDTAGFACAGFGFTRTLSGVDGSLLYQSNGFKFGARGRSVAGLGDLDGDGGDDLAVAEPGVVSQNSGQAVRIQGGVPGSPFFTIAPDDLGDRFGSALASGDVNGDGLIDLLVGARRDDDAGLDSGSIRAYTVAIGVQTYCEAQVNSQGCTPTIYATGMPSATYNSFRVKAASVLNNKAGLLFWGSTPKQTPFGGGYLCVLAPTKRTPVQQSGGNPPPDDCSGGFSFHFNKPYLNQVGLLPGDQVFCQYWSRDPAGASGTTNLTDAMVFSIEP